MLTYNIQSQNCQVETIAPTMKEGFTYAKNFAHPQTTINLQ